MRTRKEIEKQISEVKERFSYLMATCQLDVYEEMDYRMYINELYEEYDNSVL